MRRGLAFAVYARGAQIGRFRQALPTPIAAEEFAA
jgi:hypothetical protein